MHNCFLVEPFGHDLLSGQVSLSVCESESVRQEIAYLEVQLLHLGLPGH